MLSTSSHGRRQIYLRKASSLCLRISQAGIVRAVDLENLLPLESGCRPRDRVKVPLPCLWEKTKRGGCAGGGKGQWARWRTRIRAMRRATGVVDKEGEADWNRSRMAVGRVWTRNPRVLDPTGAGLGLFSPAGLRVRPSGTRNGPVRGGFKAVRTGELDSFRYLYPVALSSKNICSGVRYRFRDGRGSSPFLRIKRR